MIYPGFIEVVGDMPIVKGDQWVKNGYTPESHLPYANTVSGSLVGKTPNFIKELGVWFPDTTLWRKIPGEPFMPGWIRLFKDTIILPGDLVVGPYEVNLDTAVLYPNEGEPLTPDTPYVTCVSPGYASGSTTAAKAIAGTAKAKAVIRKVDGFKKKISVSNTIHSEPLPLP